MLRVKLFQIFFVLSCRCETVKDDDLLLKSLEELVKDDLKKFQWHLKKHECISTSEMEDAD